MGWFSKSKSIEQQALEEISEQGHEIVFILAKLLTPPTCRYQKNMTKRHFIRTCAQFKKQPGALHSKQFSEALEKACFDEWHKFGQQLFQKVCSLVLEFPDASNEDIVKKINTQIDDAITTDESSSNFPPPFLQL